MALEPRLQTVADFIQGDTHADIGSDHALLPKYLLETQKIRRAVIVEKTQQPFENATAALRHLNADVRLGNGLSPISNTEVDSLSITGMGAAKIVQILQAYPERLPEKVTLQPNDNAKMIRVWGLETGFHLQAETMVQGYWRYTVLHFEKSKQTEKPQQTDTCYHDLPLEIALTYGPHLLKAKHPLLKKELEYQLPYLESLHPYGKSQLATLRQALDYFES